MQQMNKFHFFAKRSIFGYFGNPIKDKNLMKQVICLYEDAGYKNLLPLTYTRPVYDLKCGI